MSDVAVIAIFAVLVAALLTLLILTLLSRQDSERALWHEERRFLTDRAIARHTGEVLALDRSEDKRTNGPEAPKERVPVLPEGL